MSEIDTTTTKLLREAKQHQAELYSLLAEAMLILTWEDREEAQNNLRDAIGETIGRVRMLERVLCELGAEHAGREPAAPATH